MKGVVLLTMGTTAPTRSFHDIDPCVETFEIVLNGHERTGSLDNCGDVEAIEDTRNGNVINLVSLTRHVHALNLPEDLVTKKDEAITTTIYGLPFEMKLPKHLPSSMRCSASDENNGSFCEITYNMSAFCHLKPIGTIEHTVASNKQVLWVVAHAQPPPSPLFSVGATEDFPLTSWCVKRGHIKLGINVENCSAVVYPHSILCVNILGQNCSPVPVHHLTARLCETVTWNLGPNGKQYKKTRTLNEATVIVNPNWSQQWQALPDQGTTCWPKRDASIFNNSQSSSSVQLRWTIPSDIRDSRKGHFISVCHYVLVKAVTSSLFTNTPEAFHPIHVQRPPIEWNEDGSEHHGSRLSFQSEEALQSWRPRKSVNSPG